MRRIQSGQSGEQMTNQLAGNFGGAPFKYFGDWTDRIAKGELPKSKPQRPQGVERNVVVSSWEWGTEKQYLHDLISSDRRNPTVNANGPLFGSPEYATDNMPILDPKTSKVTLLQDAGAGSEHAGVARPGHAASVKPLQPSAYWGEEKVWDTRANNHNAMFDKKGRVWIAATVRGMDNPAFCKKGSDHPSAKVFPLEQSARQVAMLDPKTMKYTFVDTCFGTHHPQFGYDADDTLWLSGTGPVAGWVNTKVFDETGDAAKSQGWSPFVLDTNGNGKRDDYVEPNQPADPGKDKRIVPGLRALRGDAEPGGWLDLVHRRRVRRRARIPALRSQDQDCRKSTTCRCPASASAAATSTRMAWFGDRCRAAISRASTAASARARSMARTRPAIIAPKAGRSTNIPGPGFEGIGENSAESSYYTWVDQHNTLGLGENVPMSTANLSDGFVALKDGKMVMLRVPYPMGFYAKGFDGRIDDPNAGWKGRGLWSTNGDRTPWLMEGGKGSKPRAVHIQVRPDPLAH